MLNTFLNTIIGYPCVWRTVYTRADRDGYQRILRRSIIRGNSKNYRIQIPGIIDRGEVPVPSSLDLLLLVLYQLCLTFFLQFKGYDYMVSGAFLTFEFLNLLLNEAQTRRGTEGSKLRPQQQVNPFRFYFRNFFNRNTYQYIFFNCFKIFLFYTSYSPLLSPSIVAYSEIWCRYVIQRD